MKMSKNVKARRGNLFLIMILIFVGISMWSISASAEDLEISKMSAWSPVGINNGVFDNNKETIWNAGQNAFPSIYINLGSSSYSTPPKDIYYITGIKVLRYSTADTEPTKADIYVSVNSTDGQNGTWTKILENQSLVYENLIATINFGGTYEAKYIRFEVREVLNRTNARLARVADFSIQGTKRSITNIFPQESMTLTALEFSTTYGIAKAKDFDNTTFWRSSTTSDSKTIDIDLGSENIIDAVVLTPDVPGTNLHPARPITSVNIQYSLDASSWTNLGDYSFVYSNATNVANVITDKYKANEKAVIFPPLTKAKYIKITTNVSTRLNLAELRVEVAAPMEIGGISYDANNQVNAVTIVNKSTINNATMVIAVYDNSTSMLKGVHIQDITSLSPEYSTIALTNTALDWPVVNTDDRVKVMIWNTVDAMQPNCLNGLFYK